MASVNKVIILGNLGQDPELRSTQSGTPVCTLSIATTDVRTDANGMRQDKTEWHRVIVWTKQAENCAKYLSGDVRFIPKDAFKHVLGKIKRSKTLLY